MKKRKVLGISAIVLLSLFVGPFLKRKIQSTVTVRDTFKTTKAADFYVVSSDGIRAFGLKENKIKQLSHQKSELAHYPNPTIAKAEFENRYLVFSDQNSAGPSGINRPTISMDFQKGKIIKTPTAYDPYTGSGYSENYFYTHQATSEDGGIYTFDKFGKKVNSYQFNSLSIGYSKFVGAAGKLYFPITHDPKSGKEMANHENSLLIFDEKPKLKLVDEIYLEDNPTYTYMPNEIEQVGDYLYMTITGVRDRESKERIADNRLMVINKKDYQKSFITLGEYYPSYIYKSKDEKYLFITHPTTMVGKSILSIYNVVSGAKYQIDLSQLMDVSGTDKVSGSDVVSVNTSRDGEKLLILTHDAILVYDLVTSSLSASVPLSEGDNPHIYVWANR